MRRVADFMAEWWLAFVVPLLIVAVLVLLFRLFVSDKKGETFQYVVILVLVIVVGPQAWVWVSDLFSSPQRSAPTVPPTSPETGKLITLPPHGKSQHISQPVQTRLVFEGEGIRIHCVYRRKPEVSYRAGEAACPSGDMPYVYVSNETGKEITVKYWLESMK